MTVFPMIDLLQAVQLVATTEEAPSSVGQVSDYFGIIGGIVTIALFLGTIGGYYIKTYFERQKSDNEIAELKKAVDSKDKNIADKKVEIELLRQQLNDAAVSGSKLLAIRKQLRDEIKPIISQFGAERASVYIPTSDESGSLIIVAFYPTTEEIVRLSKSPVPATSAAGQCFLTGEGKFITHVPSDPSHMKEANELTKYSPVEMLMAPIFLKSDQRPLGLIQLLNSDQGTFLEEHVKVLENLAKKLAPLLAHFDDDPDLVRECAPNDDFGVLNSTALLCDISNSKKIFQELSPHSGAKLIDEYLDAICDAANQNSGTIANYTGDGALFHFRSSAGQKDHSTNAVIASAMINERFSELRNSWSRSYPFTAKLNHRCAISSGKILSKTIGYRQTRRPTILGQPISDAANMLKILPRNSEYIAMSEGVANRAGCVTHTSPLAETSHVEQIFTPTFILDSGFAKSLTANAQTPN